MLIGIEFKRKKVFLLEENRTVWFWRIAPYTKDVDSLKLYSLLFAIAGMSIIMMIGSCVRDAHR